MKKFWFTLVCWVLREFLVLQELFVVGIIIILRFVCRNFVKITKFSILIPQLQIFEAKACKCFLWMLLTMVAPLIAKAALTKYWISDLRNYYRFQGEAARMTRKLWAMMIYVMFFEAFELVRLFCFSIKNVLKMFCKVNLRV